MKRLTATEEIEFLKDLHADASSEKVLHTLRDSFNVLQTRSQLLLGLVTICLTITGFSGIKIAQSGPAARACIFLGIISVLLTALLLVAGPLHLQWLTQRKAGSTEETLAELIRRRDIRTRLYHLATMFLIIGLGGYVLSLGSFLLSK